MRGLYRDRRITSALWNGVKGAYVIYGAYATRPFFVTLVNMRLILSSFMIFIGVGCAPAPTGVVAPVPIAQVRAQSVAATSSAGLRFPQSWVGRWEGTCQLRNPVPEADSTFTMGLQIQPLGPQRWQWQITYRGESLNQTRAYELQTVDVAAGHYVVDEKNGILLDAYLDGNQLMEQFEVGNSRLTVTHRLESSSRMAVDMMTFSNRPGRTSGAASQRVSAYPLLNAQRCSLQRQNT
jgi:hypothetical protein